MGRIARLLIAGALTLSVAAAVASDDVRGSKDHPLLTRYPDSRITEYQQNYNNVAFTVGIENGAPKVENIEGQAT